MPRLVLLCLSAPTVVNSVCLPPVGRTGHVSLAPQPGNQALNEMCFVPVSIASVYDLTGKSPETVMIHVNTGAPM